MVLSEIGALTAELAQLNGTPTRHPGHVTNTTVTEPGLPAAPTQWAQNYRSKFRKRNGQNKQLRPGGLNNILRAQF